MTKLSLTGYRTYRFLQVDLSDETLRRTKNSTNRRFYYEDKNFHSNVLKTSQLLDVVVTFDLLDVKNLQVVFFKTMKLNVRSETLVSLQLSYQPGGVTVHTLLLIINTIIIKIMNLLITLYSYLALRLFYSIWTLFKVSLYEGLVFFFYIWCFMWSVSSGLRDETDSLKR